MEQANRNLEFMETCFIEVLDKLKLSDELLDHLCTDRNNPFSKLMSKYLKKFTEKEKKLFILMQYTKGRHPTNYLAQVLNDFGMSDLSIKLLKYNKSEKFLDYSADKALTVQKAIEKRTNDSMSYKMDAHPRGVAIIVLNEDELEKEALAWKYVLEQLYFKVKIRRRQTAQQIKSLFSYVSSDQKYKDMDALITVAIGHGEDECFLGSNYEPKNSTNVEKKGDKEPVVQSSESNQKETDKQKQRADKISLVELVDIFNEPNSVFKDKPKINIFNCCRSRTVSVDQNIRELQQLDLAKCFNKDWQSRNAHTAVIYSCAEGLESEYDVKTGFSDFGQAFLHTIAQYACNCHLSDLILKVNQRLKTENMEKLKPLVIMHACPLNMYFNP